MLDDASNALLGQIMQRESGGRNVYNYKHDLAPNYYTASGYYQIVDSTWREGAKLAGVDTSQYPTAISAPKDVQTQVAQALFGKYGEKPWAESSKPGKDLAPAPGLSSGNQLALQAPVQASDSAPVTPAGVPGPSPQIALNLIKLLTPAGHNLVPVDYDPFAPGMPGSSPPPRPIMIARTIGQSQLDALNTRAAGTDSASS